MPTIITQRLLKVKFLLKSKKEESSRVYSLEFLSNRSLYATTLRGQTAAAGTLVLSQLKLLFYYSPSKDLRSHGLSLTPSRARAITVLAK